MHIIAIYGSPRRHGNTTILLQKAVEGAKAAGCFVEEIVLRDLSISPCLELYGCKKDGRCIIQDDYQMIYDRLQSFDGIMLASPIFFYAISGQAKLMIDRCQSFWVKKNWIETKTDKSERPQRKGLFIAAGAGGGKKLFDGALLTIRYFFEAIDTVLWDTLLVRGVDFEGDILKKPEYIEKAYEIGFQFCQTIIKEKKSEKS